MSEGVVFDIQHYAVHDGPGIRTLVFLKGCPLRCAWCCNPESQRFEPELMHASLRCRSHASCVEACPFGAARMVGGSPAFDRAACSSCSAHPCVEACPSGALSVAGVRMTSDQVMARVAADRAFYTNSGGGVTFSGGEPLAQPGFMEELLARSRALGIHTAVETCGCVDAEVLSRIEPLVDLFLFDLKVMDSARHERVAGASNGAILGNLETLAAKRRESITVRVPLVPGYTDDEPNLDAIATFVASLGLRRVEVMPYHSLGSDKYRALGRHYPLAGARDLEGEAAEACAARFRAHGLACERGGE